MNNTTSPHFFVTDNLRQVNQVAVVRSAEKRRGKLLLHDFDGKGARYFGQLIVLLEKNIGHTAVCLTK